MLKTAIPTRGPRVGIALSKITKETHCCSIETRTAKRDNGKFTGIFAVNYGARENSLFFVALGRLLDHHD